QLWQLDRVFLSIDLSDRNSAKHGLSPARIVHNRCTPFCFMRASGERDPGQRETFSDGSKEKPAYWTTLQPHPAERVPLASFLYSPDSQNHQLWRYREPPSFSSQSDLVRGGLVFGLWAKRQTWASRKRPPRASNSRRVRISRSWTGMTQLAQNGPQIRCVFSVVIPITPAVLGSS